MRTGMLLAGALSCGAVSLCLCLGAGGDEAVACEAGRAHPEARVRPEVEGPDVEQEEIASGAPGRMAAVPAEGRRGRTRFLDVTDPGRQLTAEVAGCELRRSFYASRAYVAAGAPRAVAAAEVVASAAAWWLTAEDGRLGAFFEPKGRPFAAAVELHPLDDLCGRVVAADGRPVAGAEVWLTLPLVLDARSEAVWRSVTGADGSFRIPGVPRQKAWRVEARSPLGVSGHAWSEFEADFVLPLPIASGFVAGRILHEDGSAYSGPVVFHGRRWGRVWSDHAGWFFSAAAENAAVQLGSRITAGRCGQEVVLVEALDRFGDLGRFVVPDARPVTLVCPERFLAQPFLATVRIWCSEPSGRADEFGGDVRFSSDARPRLRVPALARVSLQVLPAHAGLLPTRVLSLPAGAETLDVPFEAVVAHRFKVVARDAHDAVADALVILHDESSESIGTRLRLVHQNICELSPVVWDAVRTDRDGRATVRGPGPGPGLRVTVYPDCPFAPRTVPVVWASTGQGGSFTVLPVDRSGTVRVSTSPPLADGYTLHLIREGGSRESGGFGKKLMPADGLPGVFEVGGMPAGNYWLELELYHRRIDRCVRRVYVPAGTEDVEVLVDAMPYAVGEVAIAVPEPSSEWTVTLVGLPPSGSPLLPTELVRISTDRHEDSETVPVGEYEVLVEHRGVRRWMPAPVRVRAGETVSRTIDPESLATRLAGIRVGEGWDPQAAGIESVDVRHPGSGFAYPLVVGSRLASAHHDWPFRTFEIVRDGRVAGTYPVAGSVAELPSLPE